MLPWNKPDRGCNPFFVAAFTAFALCPHLLAKTLGSLASTSLQNKFSSQTDESRKKIKKLLGSGYMDQGMWLGCYTYRLVSVVTNLQCYTHALRTAFMSLKFRNARDLYI